MPTPPDAVSTPSSGASRARGASRSRGGSAALLWLFCWAALCAASAWRVVDLDALSRLAVGRYIAQTGEVPQTDPFTFSRPDLRWSNPEWGGDLLWYGVHSVGGFPALVLVKFALVALGWALAFALARRRGAAPLLVAALLLIALPAVAARLHVRNEIHAQWLIPLYLLLLLRAQDSPRRLWPLLPLAVVWTNLHSSFVIGWALIGAALLEQLFRQPRRRASLVGLGGLLLAHPLLALIGPNGTAVYGQLLEHLQGGDVYRSLILEWIPPATAGPTLGQLPLHLLGIIGLCSFLPRVNRRQVGALARVGLALALAHGSQRFSVLLAVLAVPDIAANLQRWLGFQTPARSRLGVAVSLALGLGLAAGTIWQARGEPQTAVLSRHDAPLGAARLLATQAPEGSRLFNPYNSGPYLLWLTGPRVQIYIDPRNNLGAELLQRYVDRLVPDADAFELEAQRQHIDFALVDLADGRFDRLAPHLRRAPGWRLVHFDGRFTLYARPQGATADLTRRRAYRVIEGRLAFEYLAASAQQPVRSLDSELSRLDREAPALARAVRGYLALLRGGGQPPLLTDAEPTASDRQGMQLLSSALPELPPSAALMSYLATAHARLGNETECTDLIRVAQRLFPAAPHLLALRATLARRNGDARQTQHWLRALRRQGERPHPLWQLVTQN